MTTSKKRSDAMTRREMLGRSATVTALTGAGVISGVGTGVALAPRSASAASAANVGPGDLDEYYGFWSSGQTGEVRIVGVPSMREFMRIPVFNRCSATGWGQTNESLKVLRDGMLPETKAYLESRGRHLDERRCPPSPHVVHRRHLRRALPVHQRQGEHASGAYPL